MGFRTVIITQHCKCSYKNDFMVIRGENLQTIHLSEIDTVIFDSTAVSVSSYLLCEFMKWKINLLVCDEHHNPNGELLPLYANYHSSKKILSQIYWDKAQTDAMWTRIVHNKISNQAKLLKKYSKIEYLKLEQYLSELEFADASNREGHAAKVYFNALFGKDFSRKQDNDINAALNYGYSLLLSTINKEVLSCGYITQIGIFHKGEFNDFNLSCDIMEPFRVMVDDIVMQNIPFVFDSDMKYEMLKIFNRTVLFKDAEYYFSSALSMYTKNILKCITENKPEEMEFFDVI